jgi:FAD/FMN-containing dehydrogenase
MVSTNASGARTVRYGSMRPWVQALSCITIGGERARLERGVPGPLPVPEAVLREKADLIRARFPRTSKNSAGYALDAWLDSGDTLDLLIGAEGTLAIITEIEWRLDPVPAYRAGLRVDLDSLDRLTEAVEGLLPLQPSALELLDRTFLDLVRTTRDVDVAPGATESVLLLEFEGDDQQSLRGTVGDAVRTLKSSALNIETALVPQDEEKIWNLRHAASPIIADLPPGRRSLQVIEDACVPIPRMGEYIASVRTLAARLHVPVVIFGHAGDGNIHVNLLPDTRTAGWEQSVELIHQDITTEVIRLGGTTSGEHGDGRIRGAQLEQLYGAEIMELFRLLKDTFDPAGILNPGVKLPVKGGLPGALRDLKVGDLAAGIPDDIAETLREIERNGDYLRDRLYLS